MLFRCQHCHQMLLPGVRVCNKQACIRAAREQAAILRCEETGLNFAFPRKRDP